MAYSQFFLKMFHCLWHSGGDQHHRNFFLQLPKYLNSDFRKLAVLIQEGSVNIGKDDLINHSKFRIKSTSTSMSSGCSGR